MDIAAMAAELNLRAASRPIGRLQAVRARLKQHKRQLPERIFGDQTIHEDYAFHIGGRTELQFNFGADEVEGQPVLRHGVALSFQRSQTLPDIGVLLPRVARFNEFLRVYPDEYAMLRMWHYSDGIRSSNYTPSAIAHELCRDGVFVFLGRWSELGDVDADQILSTFDQLLPLYEYVEGSQDSFPSQASLGKEQRPSFVPGCTIKKSSTSASLGEREVDITLRHNDLQLKLFSFLADRHGVNSVGTEQLLGTGTRVDVIVKTGDGRIYYEIKTDLSARACVRAALAQLLEYSYWPGEQEALSLVVVGEPQLDSDTRTFLASLQAKFGIPIEYAQFDMQRGRLVE